MSNYVLPVLYGLFVWWASTVLIIYLDNLPKRTFKWSLLGATAVLGACLYGLYASAGDTSVTGAYVAFTCGVLAWGWQEISFYMGYVTGPRKQPCKEGCKGWAHFGHAIMTNLWHELAIIAAAGVVVALTWDAPNQVGLWTFLILWWMHQSAKLNVFLGVRNLNEEFLPEHLSFLKSYFTKKPMNLLFPVSVTISSIITYVLVMKAANAPTAFEAVGFTFLAAFMALAVLEHWLLVLPLPTAGLWQPGLKARGDAPAKPFDAEIVVGFLGAGKTTVLRRMLNEVDPEEKTVVLVNDFGELGLDGTLLSGRGADVVELPNGCICCSLRKDLAAQLKDVIARMAPDRVLIEPSGVADVTSLLRVLHGPEVKGLVKSLRLTTVIDAGAFLRDHARLPEYFEAQARLAPVFILNKTDRATAEDLAITTDTLKRLNPHAEILPAVYGAVDPARAAAWKAAPAVQAHTHSHDEHADEHEHHHHDHGPVALGLENWSTALPGFHDARALRSVLEAVAAGAFGDIDRLKGILQVEDGWLQVDVAGGEPSIAAHAARPEDTARVMAIGKTIDRERLHRALHRCTVPETAVA
ncbi:putative photosynthetic complex assembly protein PuhE [Caenispirillum salinarum]|uniref:putative photosynthetic complex assembly protein PuhE n=1 Tax=Caenispirillum salinarum TaxID=859058 RepID=UPI00384F167A